MNNKVSLLRRFPVVAVVVFAVTATTSVAQFFVTGMLTSLQRDADRISAGQWWRPVTSMFVQDGGVAGTVFNLATLLLIGAIAEQLVSRPRWLVGYFGGGLVGESAGALGWQPVGGGNSVAVNGLAGVVIVCLLTRRGAPDQLTQTAALLVSLYAVVEVLSTFHNALAVPIGCAVCVAGFNVLRARNTTLAIRIATVLAPLCAVFLLARTDIHGAALTGGLVIGAISLAVARRR
ncbi:rhomboid family intramembrane serine protease [Solihabitans fulvus]|nr:rhomboid family intramembrane serine protease [Solihabitans fulvus]